MTSSPTVKCERTLSSAEHPVTQVDTRVVGPRCFTFVPGFQKCSGRNELALVQPIDAPRRAIGRHPRGLFGGSRFAITRRTGSPPARDTHTSPSCGRRTAMVRLCGDGSSGTQLASGHSASPGLGGQRVHPVVAQPLRSSPVHAAGLSLAVDRPAVFVDHIGRRQAPVVSVTVTGCLTARRQRRRSRGNWLGTSRSPNGVALSMMAFGAGAPPLAAAGPPETASGTISTASNRRIRC